MNYFEYKELKSKEKNNRLFNESKIKKVFIERLKRKEFSATIFEDNCKTLNVITCRSFPNDEEAMYDLFSNNILVKKRNYIDCIWHELLHASSTLRTDNMVYSGLSVIDENCERIGTGLNEGVTVLLDEMLFKGITKNHDEISDTYVVEKFLCSILYDILGIFLFKCYFAADFYTFYAYLVDFNGFKKTDKFIKAFDKICFENYYSDDSENPNIKGIAASFNYICFYLLELAIKHIVRNYETGYIDNQTYKEGIKGCLDYFSKVCVKDENDKIYEIDKEKIKRIIKKNISKC